MQLSLHTIRPKKGSRKVRKHIGRGLASTGTYSGRGVKGQKARSGGRSGLKLKGFRKIMLSTPKLRGFRSLQQKPEVLNLDVLSDNFEAGSKISPKQLFAKKLVTSEKAIVKILGKGTLEKKFIVQGCLISESAKEKIEKAGGSVIVS